MAKGRNPLIAFRAPQVLEEALARAAEAELTTPPELMRRFLVAGLRSSGHAPAPVGARA